MWVLYLNPMRDRTEARHPICRAETREALEAFLARETVEPYTDEEPDLYFPSGVKRWSKVFRKGGPIEWYNPPFSAGEGPIDIGTVEDFLVFMREKWEREYLALMKV